MFAGIHRHFPFYAGALVFRACNRMRAMQRNIRGSQYDVLAARKTSVGSHQVPHELLL